MDHVIAERTDEDAMEGSPVCLDRAIFRGHDRAFSHSESRAVPVHSRESVS